MSARAKAPTDSSMMSVAQAADLIGISRAAMYKVIEKGAIKSPGIGNVTVVKRASVIAYGDSRPHEEKTGIYCDCTCACAPAEGHTKDRQMKMGRGAIFGISAE